MSELGKMIRLRRKQLGMTQKELAERAHVSQQMITALETGRIKRSTSLPELFRSLDLDISKAVNNAVSAPDYAMAYPLISKADYQAILSIIRNSLFEYHEQHLDKGEPFIVNSLNIDEVTATIGKKLTDHLHISVED